MMTNTAPNNESLKKILSYDYVWFRFSRRDEVKYMELSWPFITKKAIISRGFRFLVLLRLMLLARRKGSFRTARIIKRRILRQYLAEISFNTEIGHGLQIPHPQGIVIGGDTKIGNFVSIGQYCTLGANFGKVSKDAARFPVIGDNVRILAGSVIVGPILVSQNSVVGANSVVTKDVEEGFIVSGVPAVPINAHGQKIEQLSEKVERLEFKLQTLEQLLHRLAQAD